jgi:hypothetical protein
MVVILVILALVILIGLGTAIGIVLSRPNESPATSYAQSKSSKQNAKLLAKSVNLFQQGLADPMIYHTAKWQDQAAKIVADYNEEI